MLSTAIQLLLCVCQHATARQVGERPVTLVSVPCLALLALEAPVEMLYPKIDAVLVVTDRLNGHRTKPLLHQQ
ncbi:MAG TPA: hypothetical protein VMV69_30250 [Pirellulales bacterium]|nr:hypothetical protein [Pirellulales bacterium]